MDRVKKWFANIHQYENLSLGGARTLADIEKEYDQVQSQNQQQSTRIRELEEALENLTDLVADIEMTLFHHNHDIVGFHQNGYHEPIMNLVADFDMDAQKQALLLSIKLKKERLNKKEQS